MEFHRVFCIAFLVVFIYSQTGETIPLRLKRSTKKYVSPIENFLLMTSKYRVQPETIQNATDPKNGTDTSNTSNTSNIAVQSLNENNTQVGDVTTTQRTNASGSPI